MAQSTSNGSSARNINVGELLKFSNEIRRVNQLKIEKETLVHQLTLFKTFSELVKGKPKNVGTVFQVDFNINPGYSEGRGGCGGGASDGIMMNMCEYETLQISVSNVSQGLTFDPKFWSILIQHDEGQVHVWNLQNCLKPGDSETFSTQFYPVFNLKQGRQKVEETGQKIQVHIVFSLQWLESNYTKSFHIQSINLDILYFLNPGRRPFSSNNNSSSKNCALFSTSGNRDSSSSSSTDKKKASSTLSFIHEDDPTTDDDDDNDEDKQKRQGRHDDEYMTKKLPPVCRFNLKTDEMLHKKFIQDVLLKDCNFSRGFNIGENPYKETTVDDDVILREPMEYHAYFYEERIICSKHDNHTISFRCSSPPILQLVKDAIFKRLLKLCESRKVKLKCTVDNLCEHFYEVRLKFEALMKSKLSEQDAYAELLGVYYELRECSESFIYFAYD